MDERKNRVLQAIIEDYVSTAEPVGSRTIARKYRLGVSPATIRNEMQDLEELGFLQQPHTSAGRIPSDRGYRYYVDCLMEQRELSATEEEAIGRLFERKVHEIDALIKETTRLVSETTHQAALVTGPQLARVAFREIHLVPMGQGRAILLYVTDAGLVENQIVELPVQVTLIELQQIAHLLTDNLRGKTVEALSHTAMQALHHELARYGSLLEQTLEFLAGAVKPGERQRIYLGGTANVLSQPEFRDLERVRNLLSALDREDVIRELLAEDQEAGVAVTIGEEIKVREVQDCSLVTATYKIGGRTIGRVGVIGPKRMDYARVIALVDSITQQLSEALSKTVG